MRFAAIGLAIMALALPGATAVPLGGGPPVYVHPLPDTRPADIVGGLANMTGFFLSKMEGNHTAPALQGQPAVVVNSSADPALHWHATRGDLKCKHFDLEHGMETKCKYQPNFSTVDCKIKYAKDDHRFSWHPTINSIKLHDGITKCYNISHDFCIPQLAFFYLNQCTVSNGLGAVALIPPEGQNGIPPAPGDGFASPAEASRAWAASTSAMMSSASHWLKTHSTFWGVPNTHTTTHSKALKHQSKTVAHSTPTHSANVVKSTTTYPSTVVKTNPTPSVTVFKSTPTRDPIVVVTSTTTPISAVAKSTLTESPELDLSTSAPSWTLDLSVQPSTTSMSGSAQSSTLELSLSAKPSTTDMSGSAYSSVIDMSASALPSSNSMTASSYVSTIDMSASGHGSTIGLSASGQSATMSLSTSAQSPTVTEAPTATTLTSSKPLGAYLPHEMHNGQASQSENANTVDHQQAKNEDPAKTKQVDLDNLNEGVLPVAPSKQPSVKLPPRLPLGTGPFDDSFNDYVTDADPYDYIQYFPEMDLPEWYEEEKHHY